MRAQKAKEENPLETKGQDKVVVPRKLTYEHDMSQVMQVRARQPKRQEHKDEKEWQAACKIR